MYSETSPVRFAEGTDGPMDSGPQRGNHGCLIPVAGCALVESSRERRRHRHHPDGVRHRTDPGVRRPRTLDNSPVPT